MGTHFSRRSSVVLRKMLFFGLDSATLGELASLGVVTSAMGSGGGRGRDVVKSS